MDIRSNADFGDEQSDFLQMDPLLNGIKVELNDAEYKHVEKSEKDIKNEDQPDADIILNSDEQDYLNCESNLIAFGKRNTKGSLKKYSSVEDDNTPLYLSMNGTNARIRSKRNCSKRSLAILSSKLKEKQSKLKNNESKDDKRLEEFTVEDDVVLSKRVRKETKKFRKKYIIQQKRNVKYISEDEQKLPEVRQAVCDSFLCGEGNSLGCIKFKDIEIKREENNKGYNVQDVDLDKFKKEMTFHCEDCMFTTEFRSAFKVHFIAHANTYTVVEALNKTLNTYYCYICNMDCKNETCLNDHLKSHRNYKITVKHKNNRKFEKIKESMSMIDAEDKTEIKNEEIFDNERSRSSLANKTSDVKDDLYLIVPFDDDWHCTDDDIKTELDVDDSSDNKITEEDIKLETECVNDEDLVKTEDNVNDVLINKECFVLLEKNCEINSMISQQMELNKCEICDYEIEAGKTCDHNSRKTRLCVLCDKIFLLYRYKYHRTLHFCAKCSFKSANVDEVLKHKKENVECWYSCGKCDFKTYNSQSHKRHLKNGCSVDGKSRELKSKKSLACDKCSFVTFFRGTYLRHMKAHDNLKDDVEQYKCEICGKVCFLEKLLNIHYQRHFCNVCSFMSVSHKDVVEHRKSNPDCLLKCENCDYKTAIPIFFDRHKKYERNKNEISSKKDIKRRRDKVVNKKLLKKRKATPTLHCDSCNYQTYSKIYLKTHIERKHVDPKPYQCSQCGTRFKDRGHLNKHEKTHIDGKAYRCKACGFECDQEKYFLNHKLRHSEEEYKLKETIEKKDPRFIYCDQCEFRSKHKSSFNIHLLKHQNIRPFLCPTCGLSFFSAKDYSSHKNTVHVNKTTQNGEVAPKKLYKCSYCDYTYNQKVTIKVHERKHTGEKPYSCEYCSYKTGYPGNLRAHNKKHMIERQMSKQVL